MSNNPRCFYVIAATASTPEQEAERAFGARGFTAQRQLDPAGAYATCEDDHIIVFDWGLDEYGTMRKAAIGASTVVDVLFVKRTFDHVELEAFTARASTWSLYVDHQGIRERQGAAPSLTTLEAAEQYVDELFCEDDVHEGYVMRPELTFELLHHGRVIENPSEHDITHALATIEPGERSEPNVIDMPGGLPPGPGTRLVRRRGSVIASSLRVSLVDGKLVLAATDESPRTYRTIGPVSKSDVERAFAHYAKAGERTNQLAWG